MRNKRRRNTHPFPTVTVAITNWNGKDYLQKCLRSVAQLEYPKTSLTVLVVDNASTDGSREMMSKFYPWVKRLPQKNNLGFSAGMNKALTHSTSKYIWVLNNDVTVDKASLKALVKVAETDFHIAAVGGKVYLMDKPDTLQYVWGTIDTQTMHIELVGVCEKDRGQYDRQKPDANYIPLLCLLRKQALNQVGFLDERFFHGFEDTDLMLRFKQKGFKLFFTPTAKIWHKGAAAYGVDTPRTLYYLQRNNLLIRDKHSGFTLVDHVNNIKYFVSLLPGLIKASEREKYLAVIRGIIDFYRQKFGKGSY